MRKSLGVAVVLALLVSSCAHMYLPGRPGEPRPVGVRVNADRQIFVDQEPIYVAAKDVPIVWRLPLWSPFTFEPGLERIIVKEAPPEEFRCSIAEGGKVLTCIDRNSKPGRYKYELRVLEDGKPLTPLDPSIWNR